MRTELSLAVLLCLVAAGAAEARERIVKVAEIEEVQARDGLRVELSQGPASVVVDGAPAELDRVEVRVRGSTVSVAPRLSLGVFGEPPRGVVVRIAAPSLRRLQVSNGAAVSGDGLALRDVHVQTMNGGVATLAGACAEGVFEAERGGVIHGGALRCREVTVLASMGGVAQVQALEGASGKAAFGGVIEISGDPSRRALQTSLGGVIKLHPVGEGH